MFHMDAPKSDFKKTFCPYILMNLYIFRFSVHQLKKIYVEFAEVIVVNASHAEGYLTEDLSQK